MIHLTSYLGIELELDDIPSACEYRARIVYQHIVRPNSHYMCRRRIASGQGCGGRTEQQWDLHPRDRS